MAPKTTTIPIIANIAAASLIGCVLQELEYYLVMSRRLATRSSVFTRRFTWSSVWAAVQEMRSRLWDADIRPEEPDRIAWDSAAPAKSLQDIRNLVELEGQKAIDWYWKAKRWKRIPSQSIQFVALLLTAAAGLAPIIIQLVKNANWVRRDFDSGPFASLFVGIAAALLGLGQAFGYSSGWTRYVLTATSMTKLLHEFRMDWVALSAAAVLPPTTEHQAALILRAKEFVST